MNIDAVLQILILVGCLVGGFYLGKYLKTNKVEKEQIDLLYLINSFVGENILDNSLAKQISRIIGKAVRLVELEYTEYPNSVKEERALDLVYEAISALGMDVELEEDALRQVIQISVGFLNPTNKDNDFELEKLNLE